MEPAPDGTVSHDLIVRRLGRGGTSICTVRAIHQHAGRRFIVTA